MRIAVIGGGVSGIVSSYLLSKKHEITIFEGNSYLGGHTNTITLNSGVDKGLGIDTGFIVLNNKNYPNFHKFLQSLDVAVRWSDMSFSYYCEESGFQFAGTTINGIFAQRKNIINYGYYKFLYGLARFCVQAQNSIREGVSDISLRDYLQENNTDSFLIENYILPMGAAIWSAPLEGILDFPAKSFLNFFKNHGLLSVFDRPKWQTVSGGSSSYVKRFKDIFTGTIYLNRKVTKVLRDGAFVRVVDAEGNVEEFDKVVFASHADQALQIIDVPTSEEQLLLGAWRYKLNHVALHTDTSLLPPNPRAWASWNYMRFQGVDRRSCVSVTYDMNRLQGLSSKSRYCVTLNRPNSIDESKIIKEISYQHPVFDRSAIQTQVKLPQLNGINNSYFCGSYFGYGFHEDAVTSAVKVAKHFGLEL